jgi:Zn-dependent M32 family carboxypeptidase
VARERGYRDWFALALAAGDIRVLANLAPGEEWLDILLHEVGHAVYDDHIDRSLPWRDLVTAATGSPLGPAAFLTGLDT